MESLHISDSRKGVHITLFPKMDPQFQIRTAFYEQYELLSYPQTSAQVLVKAALTICCISDTLSLDI